MDSSLILAFVFWNNWQKDDGGGMDPEAIRHCMSFGFTDKKSKLTIGQCMNCI